jgi:hypothetical protein
MLSPLKVEFRKVARPLVWGAATGRRGMPMAWARRRLRPDTVDRLIAARLAVWALFDVPWWWRPPGHGGPSLAVIGTFGLAAARSLPFRDGGSGQPWCSRSMRRWP